MDARPEDIFPEKAPEPARSRPSDVGGGPLRPLPSRPAPAPAEEKPETNKKKAEPKKEPKPEGTSWWAVAVMTTVIALGLVLLGLGLWWFARRAGPGLFTVGLAALFSGSSAGLPPPESARAPARITATGVDGGNWDAPVVSRALGAVYGAAVGDSYGASYEFGRKDQHAGLKFDPEALLVGGGLGFHPGQNTDDTEMATALLKELSRAGGRFDNDAVTNAYVDWLESNPLDRGETVKQALAQRKAKAPLPPGNVRSLANGTLMRASPLGITGACQLLRRPDPPIDAHVWKGWLEDNAAADAAITHSSPEVQSANRLYVAVLAVLISTGGDVQAALREADEIASTDSTIKTLWDAVPPPGTQLTYKDRKGVLVGPWFNPDLSADISGYYMFALGKVKQVLQTLAGTAVETRNDPKFGQSFFRRTMWEIAKDGGDTDTNAAIVGGVIGAALGLDAVPRAWFDQVADFARRSLAAPNNKELDLSALRRMRAGHNLPPPELTEPMILNLFANCKP